jgi:UDPglucose 6-dehydrogenase
MKIGIVGLGHVGSAMQKIFPGAVIYDKYKKIGSIKQINSCDVAFICVPTPENTDGSCNTSIVDGILKEIKTDLIVIRSTVPVGYTEKKAHELKKNIVFQPEYYGETVGHPFADLNNRGWITLGGEETAVKKAVEVYQSVYTSDVFIFQTDSKTAELAKYMENAFLATKVTFCNEFYDIAEKLGVNYNQLREVLLMDPRIGRSHTFVYPKDRGFGGSCFPKDISSIINQAEENNVDASLLRTVKEKNQKIRNASSEANKES